MRRKWLVPLLLLALLALCFLWGVTGYPHPAQLPSGGSLQAPSAAHWLGTDNLGRDTLSRLLWGGRVSLTVGVVSTAMGLFLGVILGMLAGYYPKLDNPIMRFMDLLFTFPGVLLAMLIIGMLGPSTFNATDRKSVV